MSDSIYNTVKNKIKNNYTCISSMIIVTVFMLLYMQHYQIAPFGIRTLSTSDCTLQIQPFLSIFKRKLENHEPLSYYWNSGLGGDFLPTYFYYLASPINFLIILFDDFNSFLSIEILIKVSISAATFGYYLSHRNGKIKNSIYYIALSCSYALCNYVCGYYYQIMWFDSFMIFPLIMLGYEKLLNNKKPLLYILTLAYSLYCNYYISYIICLFLLINYLYNKHESVKSFFYKGFLFAISSIISAGIAALSLIPSYIGLTKTGSIGKDVITHSWYSNIFDVIKRMFILSKPVVLSKIESDANIYCGTVVLITISIFILSKEIDLFSKIKRIILLALLLISMNESILNFIWHGFHKQISVPNRFSFLFIFLLLTTAADVLDSINKRSRKSIITALILAEILPVISYVFTDFDSILTSHQILLLSAIIILSYSILLLVATTDNIKLKKIMLSLLSVSIIVELVFNAMINLKINLSNSVINEAIIDSTQTAKKYIVNNDDSIFYREDISDTNFDNQNAINNFKGIGYFNSTINTQIPKFYQFVGIQTGHPHAVYSQPTYFINDILGVKYIYCYENMDSYINDDHYTLIYNNDGINVYKNEHYLSLGYGVKRSIEDFSFVSNNIKTANINLLANKATGIDNIITEKYPNYNISYTGCEIGIGDTKYLSIQYENASPNKCINISFQVESPGMYLLYLREDNEDIINITINGSQNKKNDRIINGYIILGKLNTGDNIDITATTKTDDPLSVISNTSELMISVNMINEENYNKFINILSANQMEVKSFKDTELVGNINLEADQLFFTTIPYDEGWHVYENGKELKKERLAGTFIGLDLGAGEHSLTFKFVPQGLYLGIIITTISWILLIILCIILKKTRVSITDVAVKENA